MIPWFVHHGLIFVPLGPKNVKKTPIDEVRGGSLWGAGTVAGPDGSRQPSQTELENAETQGFDFGSLLKRVH